MFTMPNLAANSQFILFSILFLGAIFGSLSVRRISLGPSGVFLVALVFGHFGFKLPREVMDLGLAIFIYAVGTQVGPQFFKVFRKDGWRFVVVALVMVFVSIIATIGIIFALSLPPVLGIGMYTGAVTNTPSLAIAVDMLEKHHAGDGAIVTSGYGIAYPFSVIMSVLFVQLLALVLRRNTRKEEEGWVRDQKKMNDTLSVEQYRVSNPAIFGKRLVDLRVHDLGRINFTRILRGDAEYLATPDFILLRDDIVTAVGDKEALQKYSAHIGPTREIHLLDASVVAWDIPLAASDFSGKNFEELQVWEAYHVVVSRIFRKGAEIAPLGDTVLERGDILHTVGERRDIMNFEKIIGTADAKSYESSMIPFFFGLAAGLALGAIPLVLPNGNSITLGSAAGVLIVSLFLSRFKKIGPWEMYIPTAALNIIREFGIVLFLGGAGLIAGAKFAEVFQTYGIKILLASACITIVTLLSGLGALLLMKRDILTILGSLSAGMTQPAALSAARAQAKTELPMIAYASVYPFAMIARVIMVQVLVYVLWEIFGT